MNHIFIILFTFYAVVNGEQLGRFRHDVSVGDSVPSRLHMREDSNASSTMRQQLNAFVQSSQVQTFGLDPLYRSEIKFNFDVEWNFIDTEVNMKLRAFSATGVKSINFESTAVYRDYSKNSFRIELTASIPYTEVNSEFTAKYGPSWWQYTSLGRLQVQFYRVRLQVSAILRPVQKQGKKIYQVRGLELNINADDIRAYVTCNNNIPSAKELMKKSKGKLGRMGAEAVMVEVNSLLERLSVDQVMQQE